MSLVLDLIFPRRCYLCHQIGTYLCPNHQFHLQSINNFSTGPLESSLSLFRYRGPIRQMIIDLKYHFVSDLAPTLSSLASQSISAYFPQLLSYWRHHRYYLVPLPLHPRRLNWRGFNQAEIIGRLIASQLHLKYAQILTCHQNTFSSIPNPPDNILLFADITTPSTFKSAAATLRQLETKSVWALSLTGHR
ncbi:hypothetical protein A3K55_02600 [Candidatus Shapirobacteria bacterium RBG_13_44_7]|uniref:Uncharacterized protein n=1 Tax=Candidatus Shapirobacteria bacterium RBG_13_44_7 TaxID=1802149 RepID=A0A1F7SK09_9BACT|nr:MAG: hypothetical protein A3K55_02600 [Candidatus Shapirobacteria bacterium RBG_13_44_7]